MKRLAMGSWAYAIGPYEKDPIDFDTVCRKVKELGFDGVELGAFSPHPNPDDVPEKLQRDELVGKVCHEFICPAERGKCPIVDMGQEVDNSERVLLTGAGQRVPILKTVLRTPLGGREHLLEAFVDISELTRTLTELERINVLLEKQTARANANVVSS